MGYRTIVPQQRYHSEELSPGVMLEKFYPGGLNGPNDEVLLNTPGGQVWSDFLVLGGKDDAFQMALPDIRLPANQYWPMHWHDCWTVVFVLEGQCLIGDWWMEAGDVFITEPSLEYGPLLIGPQGCRMFEIFANLALSRGGYGPEYHDHPTLQGVDAVIAERSAVNKRNEGRQILPLGGVPEMIKTRLSPGAQWDLGDPNDPDRSMMKDTRLGPNELRPAHRYGDWHAIIVLDGSVTIAGKTLERDNYLFIQPNSRVDEIQAGASGAQLLELARTSRGMAPETVA